MLLGQALKNSSLLDICGLLLLGGNEGKLFLDVVNNVEGAGGGVVATHWLTIGTDQEFLKVPCDVMLLYGGEEELLSGTNDQLRAGTRSLEEGVEVFLLCTITHSLACHSVVRNKSAARSDKFQEIGDLLIGARLLKVELVGGDGQYIKVVIVHLFFDCIPMYILLIKPSEGCGVEDDEDFPCVFVQTKHLSVLSL